VNIYAWCSRLLQIGTNDLLHIDGSPLPTITPTDCQKLLQATQKYKNAVENAEKRQKLIRAKLSETKAQSQKQQALVKQAQQAVVVVVVAATSTLKKFSSCFIDNTFYRDAPVVVLAAEFVSEDNFGTEQTDLTCPFLAFFKSAVDSDDGVGAICTDFEADKCQSDVTGLEEDSQ
jgi:hypothetical protein